MAFPTPTILVPTNGVNYSTNIETQTLSGTTSATTKYIKINGSVTGVSYTPGDEIWAWNGKVVVGLNVINVTAEDSSGSLSAPATIEITLVESNQFIYALVPTGVYLKRYLDKIEVVCAQNVDTGIIGYNFYVSYQSGGVNNSYVKINPSLISVDNPSFSNTFTTLIGTTTDTVGEIRITTTTEKVVDVLYYSVIFNKDLYNTMVAAGQLPDVGFNQEISFFFVITAVIYDPISGQVSESPYSSELEGSPISISTGLVPLPGRSQNDIILTYSRELLMNNAGIDLKPGTVIRDMMDPISEEQARVYIIQDFLSRALSVSALLDFDDANGDGVSDPVNESVLKKSLQLATLLTSADQVQNLIDVQFDNLASNVNVLRTGAQPATGTVIFYTTSTPVRDLTVSEGAQVSSMGNVDQAIPSQTYRILETKTIPYANSAAFFNPQTQHYELEVHVQAVSSGSAGNTDSYTITVINSGADSEFQVENPNPISFGTDRESNNDLSSRIQLAFFADTGTEGGYAKTAVSVPGVHGVRVEKAGDSLMYRDYDNIRKEHIGGKVDIYVQGIRTQQVSDNVAFAYSAGTGSLTGEQFTIISAVSFQFKSENPQVTAHTPIFDLHQVYNATRAAAYDITGYQIIGDGDTIDLDESLLINSTIGLAPTDVILVDYRYRSSDVFILKNQPVDNIVSVTGQLSGPLTSDNWELVKLQDYLEEGGSTIANDGLRIKFANGLPLTEFQSVVDEQHVMIQGVDEPLRYFGVDPQSVVITDTTKLIVYVRDADYTLSSGTDTTPTTVKIIDTGLIDSGQTVLINYVAIENFTIVYTINGLLADVQTKEDKMKHACADVIVKGAVQNAIDFQITIVPVPGVTNTETLTSKIQTAVANFIGKAGVGVSITQSDIVRVITGISDVDYVIMPFIRMVKADGSFIVRDDIGTPTFQVFNQGLSTSYITSIPVLTYKTIDKGGPENLFRGIFENTMPLVLQSDPLEVSGGPGRGYIQADGKIIVSSRDGNLPDSKRYQVAYYVYGETGTKDIEVASLEHLRLGNFLINYDQPRQISKQSF